MMTGVALAAMIVGAPALAVAQDQPQQPQNEMQATPAPSNEVLPDAAPADATQAPDTTGSIQPNDEAAQTDTQQPAEVTAGAEGKFLGEQDASSVLASELMGQTVYDSADESLGDINDIVWTEDGSIEGVVIGVGGFLGIGQKSVAVNYEALNVTTDENGARKLVLDASADELAAAPEFVTQAQKLAEAQAPADTGGGMTPAPAPMAPEPAPAQ
jgi:hypothetical protein